MCVCVCTTHAQRATRDAHPAFYHTTKSMNYDYILHVTARAWYPWEQKYAARNARLCRVMLASVRAALGDGAAADYLLPQQTADPSLLLTAMLGSDGAPTAWPRGSFSKRKADLLFWSGTPLSFLVRILILTDSERWAEALADVGLLDRAAESAPAALRRLGRAADPVLRAMVARLGRPGEPYHVMRYDEMRATGGDYTPDCSVWTANLATPEQHAELLQALCADAVDAARARAVLTHASPWELAETSSPPPPPAYNSYDPPAEWRVDERGRPLLERFLGGERGGGVLCQVYVNVTVPSHPANHPRLVDLKIGKSVHGGASRLEDAHAAHWMNLADATILVPHWLAAEARAIYPTHFEGSAPDEAAERLLHGLLHPYNYAHCLSSPELLLHKEHFCMGRSELRQTLRLLRSMAGAGAGGGAESPRFCLRTASIEQRYPAFWEDQ